eukprot:EC713860.1.p4 GENE.EC713860.1~~EC713860.1.p4  ORF type:complete len:57 (+),score=1.50 EC713860.1:71-241(+)
MPVGTCACDWFVCEGARDRWLVAVPEDYLLWTPIKMGGGLTVRMYCVVVYFMLGLA